MMNEKEYGVVEYTHYWLIIVRADENQQVFMVKKDEPNVLDTLIECLIEKGYMEVGWKEKEPIIST